MYGAFLLLGVAIVIEVAATAVLPKAQGFTNPVWATVVLAGYGLSIWLLTLVVKQVPVSVAYAVWATINVVLFPIFEGVPAEFAPWMYPVFAVPGIAVPWLAVWLLGRRRA